MCGGREGGGIRGEWVCWFGCNTRLRSVVELRACVRAQAVCGTLVWGGAQPWRCGSAQPPCLASSMTAALFACPCRGAFLAATASPSTSCATRLASTSEPLCCPCCRCCPVLPGAAALVPCGPLSSALHHQLLPSGCTQSGGAAYPCLQQQQQHTVACTALTCSGNSSILPADVWACCPKAA